MVTIWLWKGNTAHSSPWSVHPSITLNQANYMNTTESFYLLLERYWPIFSWLFQSRRWSASTLPSLMKERLWLTVSLAGQSDAMLRKNLQAEIIIVFSKTVQAAFFFLKRTLLLNGTMFIIKCLRNYQGRYRSNDLRKGRELIAGHVVAPAMHLTSTVLFMLTEHLKYGQGKLPIKFFL